MIFFPYLKQISNIGIKEYIKVKGVFCKDVTSLLKMKNATGVVAPASIDKLSKKKNFSTWGLKNY